MFTPRLRTAALAVAASFSLAACAYDDGYGYGGVSVGYGYYDSYYDGYGYGYPAYYGWYDNYYYPGIGYYVYDRGGRRHRWNDHHRRHWEGRRGGDWANRGHRENWSGYDRNRSVRGSAPSGRGSAPSGVVSRSVEPRRSWQGTPQTRGSWQGTPQARGSIERGTVRQESGVARRGWSGGYRGGSMGQRGQGRRGR